MAAQFVLRGDMASIHDEGEPVWEGEAYVAVNNLFDRAYQNPTATSVRNLPNYSWGRTVTVGFRKTF